MLSVQHAHIDKPLLVCNVLVPCEVFVTSLRLVFAAQPVAHSILSKQDLQSRSPLP